MKGEDIHKLMPFRALIREKCGVTFKVDGLHLLESGISKRMVASQLTDHDAYLKQIKGSEEELHHLIDLITVNETYFLREKHHFDVLCDIIMPELMTGRNSKIKVLSAGCSTGEEAYSILIALIEKYGSGIRNQVEIHGADIDRKVIQAAREGIYGKNSFRNDEHVLMKYFEKGKDHRYHLCEPILGSVNFHVCNLLSTPYPLALQGFDIIFYRNVSIYFDKEIQQQIFRNLADVLNQDGRIFLSSSETYQHNLGVLELKKCANVFLYHKSASQKGAEPFSRFPAATPVPARVAPKKEEMPQVAAALPQRAKQPATPLASGKNPDLKALLEEALADAKHKKYAEAIGRIDALLRLDPSLLKAYALKAGILANQQRTDEASALCREMLARDEWNLEAHLLLGIISRVKDDHETALKMFKGALYICSTSWLAHFYLAEIYHAQQDFSGAYREYGTTLKLLETRGIDDHGLTFFPLAFQTEQLIHLCRRSMEKISGLHNKVGHS